MKHQIKSNGCISTSEWVLCTPFADRNRPDAPNLRSIQKEAPLQIVNINENDINHFWISLLSQFDMKKKLI